MKKDKEERKKKYKQYYQKNRKAILLRMKKYCEIHKKERNEYSLLYYNKHKKEISQKRKGYSKKYYKENKSKINKANRKWAKQHPEQMRVFLKKYRKNHPDRVLWGSLKSRCKQRTKSKLEISKKEFIEWYNKQEKKCVYCKITEANWGKTKDSLGKLFKKLQIDRKNNNEGYKLNNIVLACARCNLIKSDFFTYNQMLKIGRIVNATRQYI